MAAFFGIDNKRRACFSGGDYPFHIWCRELAEIFLRKFTRPRVKKLYHIAACFLLETHIIGNDICYFSKQVLKFFGIFFNPFAGLIAGHVISKRPWCAGKAYHWYIFRQFPL